MGMNQRSTAACRNVWRHRDHRRSRPLLTSYARRALKINENGLTARQSVGSDRPSPGVGDIWLSSPLRHSRDFWQKPPGLSLYFRPLDSVLKVKLVIQIAQNMAKQVQELHTSKVKHTQTKQSKRREIVINRNVQRRHIQSIYTTEHPKRTTKAKAYSLLARNKKR